MHGRRRRVVKLPLGLAAAPAGQVGQETTESIHERKGLERISWNRAICRLACDIGTDHEQYTTRCAQEGIRCTQWQPRAVSSENAGKRRRSCRDAPNTAQITCEVDATQPPQSHHRPRPRGRAWATTTAAHQRTRGRAPRVRRCRGRTLSHPMDNLPERNGMRPSRLQRLWPNDSVVDGC